MHDLIEEIYATGLVHDESGTGHQLHSAIDRYEGELLHAVITSDPSIRKTLEIGCAYGLSALHICAALAARDSAKHTIIDPHQTGYWHGIGIHNLRRAGFDFFELIEEPSEFVLSALAQSQAGTYDLVFIDGVHTFDHVLVDFFYANQLIRVGGYIVLDDCNMASISKAVAYASQYPCYQLLREYGRNLHKKSRARQVARVIRFLLPPSMMSYILPKKLYDGYYSRTVYPSMVVLKKVCDDKRPWDWFKAFSFSPP